MNSPPTKDWASLSEPNAELETILPSLGGFQLVTPTTTIKSLRALGAGRPLSAKWPEVVEDDFQISMRDGISNLARTYIPITFKPGDEGLPVLVMICGGAWIMGNLELVEGDCRAWTKEFGGVAVSLSHRHAPEHPFPGPHEDIEDAVRWIAKNFESLNADPSKGFILGGVEYKSRVISWEQNKNAPIFNRPTSEFNMKMYNPDPFSPLRSPLLFPTGHRDLPPAYFIIAGADPWRDLGLLYEEILREDCGVKTKLDIFPGLPHAFWGLFPQASFSKEHREKSVKGLGWLLEQARGRR